MKQFNFMDVNFQCTHVNTKNGFKHVVVLSFNDESEKSKVCYLNRTWESYEFESALFNAVEKSKIIPEKRKADIKNCIKDYKEPNPFGALAMVAKIGDVMSEDKKERNDWKLRMLKAQFGEALMLPEDWEQLSEEIKAERLDKIVDFLGAEK